MDLVAHRVVKDLVLKYSNLKSYQDCGIVEIAFNPDAETKWTPKLLFRTLFKSPDNFRFETRLRVSQHVNADDIPMVVWFDGKAGYSSDPEKKVKKIFGPLSVMHTPESIIGECLSVCFPFSGSISRFVHPLLFQHLKGRSGIEQQIWESDLSDPKIYRLHSSDYWLSISRELLQIEEISDSSSKKGLWKRTRFTSVILDADIDVGAFERKEIEAEIEGNQILADLKSEMAKRT